jgi:outer membrane protein assembly factor BamB
MKSQSRSRLFVTAFAIQSCLALVPDAPAANWPGWRGPDGSGVTQERNLPLRWSATENVRWKIELPERGNSTPAVWGDRIFVTQAVQKENRRTLMCLDRRAGKLLWQKGTIWKEAEGTHESNPYCSSSPVTDGERVIAWYGPAGVFCYDFDGEELWKRDLGKQEHEWGYGSSPVLYQDLCILYHGPGKGAYLIALDKKSGKTIWKVNDPLIQKRPRTDGFKGQEEGGMVGSFASPLLVKAKGREELIMTYPQLLCGFDPKTGKELWRCDGLNELIYASPVASDGVVVGMGGFFGNTIAVKSGSQGDVTGSQRLWKSVRTKTGIGSGVVHDGHFYILNSGGIAECIELKTGKTIWTERVKGKGPKSDSWSSMVLAGGNIYILNQSSDTVVLKASPKFEVVAVNALENELANASHAVSDGEIFIRTHTHLWCIGAGPKTAQLK